MSISKVVYLCIFLSVLVGSVSGWTENNSDTSAGAIVGYVFASLIVLLLFCLCIVCVVYPWSQKSIPELPPGFILVPANTPYHPPVSYHNPEHKPHAAHVVHSTPVPITEPTRADQEWLAEKEDYGLLEGETNTSEDERARLFSKGDTMTQHTSSKSSPAPVHRTATYQVVPVPHSSSYATTTITAPRTAGRKGKKV